MKNMNVITSLNTLRFLLAICVFIGHFYILVFWNGNPKDLIGLQNLAVDGFFILSGFLLARSCQNLKDPRQFINKDRPDLGSQVSPFCYINLKRYFRLLPELIFASVFTLIISFIFQIPHPNPAYLLFNGLLLSNINKLPAIVEGSWFISVLFYVTILYTFIYYYFGKFQTIISILLIFLAFSYLFADYGNLSLNAYPLICNFISAGFLKGVMDIGIGFLLFVTSNYLRTNPFYLRSEIIKLLLILFEISGIFLICFCMVFAKINQKDFFILFGFSFLIPILYFRKEFFLKFLSYKFWNYISGSSYMFYLTHVIIIKVLNEKITISNNIMSYLCILLLCLIVAQLLYKAQIRLISSLLLQLSLSNK